MIFLYVLMDADSGNVRQDCLIGIAPESQLVPAQSKVALKEWSVTIEALARGQQSILLRKGGIREDGKHFKVEHDGFFLYPTQYHQGPELLKPDCRALLDGLDDDPEPVMVTLGVFAEVTDVIEVSDEPAISALNQFHIFSDEYAAKRAHWKPRHPLNVLVVRCHRLQMPQALPVMEKYVGCKSWVELVEPYPVGTAHAVLRDKQFESVRAQVKDALALTGARSPV